MTRLPFWFALCAATALVVIGFVLWLSGSTHGDKTTQLGAGLISGAVISYSVALLNWANQQSTDRARSADQARDAASRLQLALGLRDDLTGVDLRGRDLAGFFLGGKTLVGASLAKADLSEVDLVGAKLLEADLSRADSTKS